MAAALRLTHFPTTKIRPDRLLGVLDLGRAGGDPRFLEGGLGSGPHSSNDKESAVFDRLYHLLVSVVRTGMVVAVLVVMVIGCAGSMGMPARLGTDFSLEDVLIFRRIDKVVLSPSKVFGYRSLIAGNYGYAHLLNLHVAFGQCQIVRSIRAIVLIYCYGVQVYGMIGVNEDPRGEAAALGKRIRAVREERGLSLRALAEGCELSVNAISMIERGESSPRASSLHLLARALGVRITDFFEEQRGETVLFVRRTERPSTLGASGAVGMLGSGLLNQQMEPFILTLEAGVSEPETSHPGQEFVLCNEGSVEYSVGGETYLLHQGDSLLFDATKPHGFKNPGFRRAEVLVVFSSCEGTGPARRRHLGE